MSIGGLAVCVSLAIWTGAISIALGAPSQAIEYFPDAQGRCCPIVKLVQFTSPIPGAHDLALDLVLWSVALAGLVALCVYKPGILD